MEAKLGSLDDASRILGMGRLPDAKMKIASARGAGSGASGAHRGAHGPSNPGRHRGAHPIPRRPKTPQKETPQKEQQKSKLGEVPVFQLGERPLLFRPASSSQEGKVRISRFVARKQGTPRRGTPWEMSLRQSRIAPFLGNAGSEDIEMCLLHAGEAFGLGSLFDPKSQGECSYLSSCEVRVESSEAKILVLTPGSLLYLNENLARSLVEKAKQQEDPVAPSLKSIKRERLNRSNWIVRKQQVLHQVVMQED
eukprot:Skav215663  [mRNA]  locus=scaffold2709:125975:126730:+ [translate_table: standard]